MDIPHTSEEIPVPDALRYRTATEYAVATIKEWIFAGRLAPGERLDQFELGERLGMSRAPVRTALERLAGEGLVDLLPHRGAIVTEISQQDMLDLYFVRNHLESLATRLAASQLTAEQLDSLEHALTKTAAQVADGDLEAFLSTNRQFHMLIYQAAGIPILLRIINSLWDLSERYRRAYLQASARAQESTIEHRHILNLLRRRDADAAAAYMKEHNENTVRALQPLIVTAARSEAESP